MKPVKEQQRKIPRCADRREKRCTSSRIRNAAASFAESQSKKGGSDHKGATRRLDSQKKAPAPENRAGRRSRWPHEAEPRLRLHPQTNVLRLATKAKPEENWFDQDETARRPSSRHEDQRRAQGRSTLWRMRKKKRSLAYGVAMREARKRLQERKI